MVEVIKLGSVVMLNSGGPLMTVENITKVDFGFAVDCVWFNDSEVICRQRFAPGQLVMFSDDEMKKMYKEGLV